MGNGVQLSSASGNNGGAGTVCSGPGARSSPWKQDKEPGKGVRVGAHRAMAGTASEEDGRPPTRQLRNFSYRGAAFFYVIFVLCFSVKLCYFGCLKHLTGLLKS